MPETLLAPTDLISFSDFLTKGQTLDEGIQLSKEVTRDQLDNAFEFMSGVELFWADKVDTLIEDSAGRVFDPREGFLASIINYSAAINWAGELLRCGEESLITKLSELEINRPKNIQRVLESDEVWLDPVEIPELYEYNDDLFSREVLPLIYK